jgi:hypothetical protein
MPLPPRPAAENGAGSVTTKRTKTRLMTRDWTAPLCVTFGCYAATGELRDVDAIRSLKDKYQIWKTTFIPSVSKARLVRVTCPNCHGRFVVKIDSRRSLHRARMAAFCLSVGVSLSGYVLLRGFGPIQSGSLLILWTVVCAYFVAGVIGLVLFSILYPFIRDYQMVRIVKDEGRNHIVFPFHRQS